MGMGMARGGLTRSREGHEGLWGGWRARGWPRNDTDDHGMGIGRARAQRSGARYRNRCARCGTVGMARGGLTRRLEGREGCLGGGWRAGVSRKDAKFAKGMARVGGSHGDAETRRFVG